MPPAALQTKEGETFESDTDTEVIPKLCKFLYSRLPEPIPLPQLVCEVVKQLEGAYALLIKSSVYPGELVACRRGSPLIMGMKYGIQVGAGGSIWAAGLGMQAAADSVLSGDRPVAIKATAPLTCHMSLLLLQAAAQTPRTPNTPHTPLTPKLTGTSSCGPQFFEANNASGPAHQFGLELFLASEASAVVEHTKQ